MTKRINILFFIAAIALLTRCNNRRSAVPEPSEQSFDSTLTVHLDAIKTADLTRLDPTVNDSVTMISPFGDKTDSKTAFMNLHRQWFSQKKNWQWLGEVIKKEQSGSMAYALIRYRYTQKDSTDAVLIDNTNFLVLIFKNSIQGWQLVHDQNTAIPGHTAAK